MDDDQDYERGRRALDVLQDAGLEPTDFIESETTDNVAEFGRSLARLWSEATPDLLGVMEKMEDAETLTAFARYLQELGESLDQEPSPAVARFLEQYG